MNFDLSDEQRMLADSAQRFVRERCSLERKREIERDERGLCRERWAEFAHMGWLALGIDEAQGGLGGGPVELTLLGEALGRGLVNEPVFDSALTCGRLLAHPRAMGGALALLDTLLAGEAVVVLAHLEAGERNDYEAQVTNTRAQRDGQGWRISGVKHLVRHGPGASHALVSARLEGRDGFGLFAVPMDAVGVQPSTYRLIDGSRGADLHLVDVALAADALVLDGTQAPDGRDEGGPGLRLREVLAEVLDRSLLASCAAALGSMEAVMALTADYLKTRVQYGQPLARFQALQHRMAEMLVETEQARAALWRAIAAAEGDDPVERVRAVSAAKWLIARAGLFVTGQGIQLHGGIGVTEEYAVGHHYKALVAFDKRLGESDFHLLRSSDLFEAIPE